MMKILKRFSADTRGTQAIEFVIVAPIFLILIMGVVEVGRFILVNQKVSKTAYAMNDIVSQFKGEITQASVEEIFDVAKDTMYPFTFDSDKDKVDGMIISATNNVPPPPDTPSGLTPGKQITWQVAYKGKGGGTMKSKIGAKGAAPNFAAITDSGFDLELKEGAFVVEVEYTYNTIFAPNTFMSYFTGQPQKLSYTNVIPYRKGGNIPQLTTKASPPPKP